MKISIITAVYNNKDQISDAIESVLSQTYSDIEYIIVDGDSTDGTVEIIKSYGSHIAKFVSEKDEGIYSGLNKGIQMATGDVIGFLHSDDFYLHDRVIEMVVEKFKKKDCDGVYGDLIYVEKDNTNKVVRHWNSGKFEYANLKKGWMPPHPAFFLKKSVYQKFGLYDTDFKISADYNFILKILSSRELQVCYLSNVLYVMRLGGASNRDIKSLFKKSAEDFKALRSNKIGNITTLFAKILFKIPQYFKTTDSYHKD